MTKRAVSVTLRPDNVLWLKTRVKARGRRSLSEALDEIITQARAGAAAASIRSVVGHARVPATEASLSEAAREIRVLFDRSILTEGKPVGIKKRRRSAVRRKHD